MTATFYEHWHDVPEGIWRWKNFSPGEIACRGTGKPLVQEVAMHRLQALRNRLGKPLIVRSAYRSPKHNRTVGGANGLGLLHRDAVLQRLADIAAADGDELALRVAEQVVQHLEVGELVIRRQQRMGLGLALDLLDLGQALVAVARVGSGSD